MWERKRLDLTVEAVILKQPKWHPLFTPDEIVDPQERLREYGIPVE